MFRVLAALCFWLLADPASAQFCMCQVAQGAVSGGASGGPTWTIYTPATGTGSCGLGTYTGTCITYVSASGNDSNTCTAAPPVNNSFATPCLTLAHALSLARTGKPDWIVLKNGDTWVNQGFGNITQSGQNCSNPLLFGTYGSGSPRPIIELNTSFGGPGIGAAFNSGVDFIAVQGLEFYAYERDPGNVNFTPSEMLQAYNGIAFREDMQCLDVENNLVHWFGTNVELQATASTGTQTFIGNIITDAYVASTYQISAGSRSQGMHAEFNGTIIFSFNLFDSNGWSPALVGPWTASMTCASPSVITATGIHLLNGSAITLNGTPCTGFSTNTLYCVINLSGSSFNVTAASGSGGNATCPNGSTTLNGTGTSSGLTVTFADAQGNIFNRNMYISEGSAVNATYNISSNSASEGAEWRAGGIVSRNLFFNDTIGYQVGDNGAGAPLVTSLSASGNVIETMLDLVQGTGNLARGGGISVNSSSGSGVVETSDLIAHPNSSTSNQIGVNLDSAGSGVNNVTFNNNTICAYNVSSQDMSGGSGNVITPNTYKQADCNIAGFLDGTRTAATYDSSVMGGPGTYADFVSHARANSKANWNNGWTAQPAVTWIRQGYNLN